MAEKTQDKPKTVLPLDMPNKYVDENGVRWTYARCFRCDMNCGILVGVDVETDRLVEIRPNAKEGTVLCDRAGKNGENLIKLHYHPKRMNHVLKRAGERGEDKWIQIPYDQAIKEIAEKLQSLIDKYGPETLVSSEGTYRTDHLWARSRFFTALGNPGNVIDPGAICWCWNYTVSMSMVGWPIDTMLPPDLDHCDTLVIWGLSAAEKYGPTGPVWRSIMDALNRPGKKPHVIVIDPMCITPATMADHWLAIRPGTDHALALAWLHEVVVNKWYKTDFLKYWTNAVFLLNKETKQFIRADEFNGGSHDDFIVWDANANAPSVWNSDKNCYYAGSVDAQLSGDYEVTLADGSTVTCWTVFDAIVDMVQPYTPEWAAGITGLRANQIADTAKLYATNGPAWLSWGLGGADQSGPNATPTFITKTILRNFCGMIDVPGAEYVGEPGPWSDGTTEPIFPIRDSEMEGSEKVTPEIRKKFIGNDQFKIMSWQGFEPIDKAYRKMYGIPRPMLHQMLCSPTLVYDAILEHKPYPVTAMICWSSNPLAWAPNTKKVYKALKALDLLVVNEYWKTPTAALADYIIPARDFLEREMLTTSEDSLDYILMGDRGCTPLYDRVSDFMFWRDLGRAMGQEDIWPWDTYRECIEYRIARAGLDYDEMMEKAFHFSNPMRYYKYAETLPNGEFRGFATPSRKSELISSMVQDLGYDYCIPTYHELPETPLSDPELAKKFPLRLTTGCRTATTYHSENRVPGEGTRWMFPYPLCYINIEDARANGIRDGEWVWIESPRGRIKQKAHVDQAIIKGTVEVMPSWWYPELPAEEPWSQGVFISNANVLTDDSVRGSDPGTGTWTNRGLLCRIYPCVDPADRTDQWTPASDYDNVQTPFSQMFDKLGCAELTVQE